MDNLKKMINGMRSLSFSEDFNSEERENVLQAISIARQHAMPYHGDFKASWLLSPFDAVEWITENQGREEFVNGTWKNAININWNIRLSDGATLVSSTYINLLELNKKTAWLHRSGFLGECTEPNAWKASVKNQLLFSRWVVLHKAKFKPEKFAFKLLDQNSVNSLFRSIATGGWFEALQVPNRIISNLYNVVFDKPCPQDLHRFVYQLPQQDLKRFMEWLGDNGYYHEVRKGGNKGLSYIDRSKIGELINEEFAVLRVGERTNYFFRQFEPDFKVTLLCSIIQKTEMPDQKTKPITEIATDGMSVQTINYTSNTLTRLFNSHRHLPAYLPEPASVSVKKASSAVLKLAKRSNHHMFIPVNIGLSYFNSAMRFILNYGDAVVEHFIAVLSASIKKSSCLNLRDNSLDVYDVDIPEDTKRISKKLGITIFSRNDSDKTFASLRKNPSLEEALQVLIGACVVVIGLMKPSRENELTHLKRECLVQNQRGYFLNFTVGKSRKMEEDRPIPVITARAIQLLQRLGDSLSSLSGENRKINKNLFYIPNIKDGGARIANSSLLNRHLDIFCDFVELPPDEFGRRWYLRIHEMRKWFLLLLFWSGRFDVLDAARWIAGQTDVAHIYAYIEREFPGEELPKLEAEYAVTRLVAFELTREASDADNGIEALYLNVLDHFKVQALSMVPESEWVDYVTALRQEDGFILEPHSIYGKGNDIIGINVSFVLREMDHE